jgi:sugar diacid utilization regulator
LFPAGSSQQQAEATAAELAGRLCALAGQQVCAAQAYQPGLARIPAALDEARNALCLAMAIPDRDHRPYRMNDLLVELAISRQPDIRQRLTDLLSPLEAGADLPHTLEVLLACNLDRERAARELCIHRRTLRYRVDRIRDLSGIDPDSVHGLQLLRAALTAARLPAPEPRDRSQEMDRSPHDLSREVELLPLAFCAVST